MDKSSPGPLGADRTRPLTYRPDIDGLRAVAVLSVVLFHLNPGWLPGGFVGVDVFFVISGYLITGILLADLRAGRFSFARFYQRRIARLFPVMITVVIATTLAAWLIYTPQDFASAGATSIAALLSVVNLKYLLQGSYFAISPDAQPFLHFWSLSVEEQFYIFFPPLVFLLFRHAPRRLAATIAGLSIISFGACVVVTFVHPPAAFYLLPTRAWELGVGALLALRGARTPAVLPAAARTWLGLAGLGAIAVACIGFDETMGFPGYAAALPVGGAAAVLLASQQPRYRGYAVLSARPVVAIGLASYTLYLWHWPVFSLTDYALFASPGWLRLALKIGITVVLTVLTWRLIERPARKGLNVPSRRWAVIAGFVVAVAIWTPIGLAIRTNHYVDASAADVAKGGLVFPGDAGAPTVVLLGDSHGSMYARTLRQICAEHGWTLRVASSAAGDALPRSDGASSALWRDSLALVDEVRPEVVVIANAWKDKLSPDGAPLGLALEALRPAAGRILLLTQPPILPDNASRAAIRGGARPPFREDEGIEAARARANAALAAFSDDTTRVVDIAPAFRDEAGAVRFTDDAGRQLYNDPGHLSGAGAARIRPRLEAALEEATGGSEQ